MVMIWLKNQVSRKAVILCTGGLILLVSINIISLLVNRNQRSYIQIYRGECDSLRMSLTELASLYHCSGNSVPSFQLPGLHKEQYTNLVIPRYHAFVFVFISMWDCVPCVEKEVILWNNIYKKAELKNVGILTIVRGTSLRDLYLVRKAFGLQTPLALDSTGSFGALMKVEHTPSMFLVDPTGKVIASCHVSGRATKHEEFFVNWVYAYTELGGIN